MEVEYGEEVEGLTEAVTGKPAKSILAAGHQSFTSGDGQGNCLQLIRSFTQEIDDIHSLDGSVFMWRTTGLERQERSCILKS